MCEREREGPLDQTLVLISQVAVCVRCVCGGWGQKGRVGCRERGREGERGGCFFVSLSFPPPFFPSFFPTVTTLTQTHTTHNTQRPAPLSAQTTHTPPLSHISPQNTTPQRERPPFPLPLLHRETDRDRQRVCVWRGRDGLVSSSPLSSLFHGGQRKGPTNPKVQHVRGDEMR